MMFLLMLLPLLLQAQLPAAQKIGFYVQDRCVDDPDLNGTYGNFFFVAGCTVRLLCKYTGNYCSERNTTDLTIVPKESAISLKNSSMVVVEKTKCSVIVDIRNISTEHTGSYTCRDRDYEGANRDRNIQVGEVPVVPQNMKVVYEPGGNITLYLDPVKQGFKLGDNDTRWDVTYKGVNGSENCSKQSDSTCRDLDGEGMCRACYIKVRSEGCGQVKAKGSVFNIFHFTISVHNKFGGVLDNSSTFLPDFIKPAPVRDILIQRNGTDWIDIRVIAPSDFDQCHLEEIKADENKLSYNYSVDLVSLRDLGLEEGETFFERYGFVRNLEDDEAALSDTIRAAFPCSYESQLWVSNKHTSAKRLEAKRMRISDLPFAGYMYNISVQTKAHYWGGVLSVKAKTKESAPKQGPQLHENFAYCSLINESCAVCLLFFKEIPRPLREGIVLNHTLLLTSLNIDVALDSKCGIGTEVEEIIGGQNNTFRVFSLPVGGVYNVSLWAQQSRASSPITNAILNVPSTPPSFAPQDIVLESSGASYDISWKPGSVANNETLRYFLHNCSAIPLQLYNVEGNGNESSLPTVPLNCVTNMASLEVPENSTNSHTFDNAHHGRGLTPAFFISTITSTNLTSGLQPVHCFYAKSRVPDQVTSLEVQKVEGETGSVGVIFRLPCGQDLNYNFGRPESYAIGFAKDDGSLDCKKTMRGLDSYQTRRIKTKLKDPVVYRETGLEEATSYCACVHLFARNDALRDMWTCKRFKTGSEPESAFPGWLIAIVVVAASFVVVVLLYGFWKCYRCYEEDRLKFGTDDEKEGMVPSPPEKNKLQNGGHINPKMFIPQDSGVDSMPASPVVIDIPEDFLDYQGEESDERQSEEDENELRETSGGHSCARYHCAGVRAETFEEEDDEDEEEEEAHSCTDSERNLDGVEEVEESGDEEEEEGEEEEEEEHLDPDVDKDGMETDQLDSPDTEVGMPVSDLSTQSLVPDTHTAGSKSAAAMAACPQVLLDIVQGESSSHHTSSTTDVPEQEDLVNEILQSYENAKAASTAPSSVSFTRVDSPEETEDRNPLSDVSKTRTLSADNSILHCPESQVDFPGDVAPNEIHETLAATGSIESDLHVYEGERKEEVHVEDGSAEAGDSQVAKNRYPAAGAEGMGAGGARHRGAEMHESETDLASEEKHADFKAASLLSQVSQLSEQSTSSVDDIMMAAQGCPWMSAELSPPAGRSNSVDEGSPDTNEDPSGTESNRNSICGPESGFESESAKETDSETDKSSTENLVPKKTREQPPAAESQADNTAPSTTLTQDTNSKPRPTNEVKQSNSHPVNGPMVNNMAHPPSKHSAHHVVKHESSDHVPLLDEKTRAESSDSDSIEFVSENKAFSMEESSENKTEQRKKDGSKKYLKVTREVDSQV